jgi:predicted oxidoreductase
LRDRLQLVTKCGIYVSSGSTTATVAHYDATAERVIGSAEKSLRLLGTDHLDVLLIHRPDWLAPVDETAEGLERLLRDGKILGAGVSNYSAAQFDALQSRLRRPLITNQIELSLFSMNAINDGTLAQCERLRTRPMAWSPLGNGRLFREGDEAASRIRRVCVELSPKYGNAGPAALAIAWILALPSAPHVVLGTNKVDHIREAASACSIRLEREDWYRLWEAAVGHRVP